MSRLKMWSWRSCVVMAAAVAMTSFPVSAQDSGVLEIGAFGRISVFDPPLGLDDWAGAGARVGYFFTRNVSLEGDISLTRTDGRPVNGSEQKVNVLPIHARLLFSLPYGEQTRLLLGAGYTHTQYGGDADASGDGAGALLGLRYRPNEKISFRLEGTVDWYADTDFVEKDNHLDYGVQFGISYMLGAGPRYFDSDGDGVFDHLDECPDTPAGVSVDARGCPLDSDGDGVPDHLDKCPGTPAGVKVDAHGCPLDSDGDGVPDHLDKCPGTPAGVKVDAHGCPLDSDGDGVPDHLDKCPGTPAGTKVDKQGCPQLFEEEKTTLILEGVNFAVGKAELTEESREVLDRVAVSLLAYPELKIEVAGHTDSTGRRAMNLKLSQERADAVRDFLVGKGVPAGQLIAKGYGPDKPIAPNDTDAGRAQNRRTELNKLD